MSKDFSRSRRVGEQIQRELAMLIQREIKDPRLGMITVSGVDLSRDLSAAKVYVTVLDESQDIEQMLEVLTHASGFLRHELGKRVLMRIVPSLQFIYDASVSRGNDLSDLINKAVASDRDKQSD